MWRTLRAKKVIPQVVEFGLLLAYNGKKNCQKVCQEMFHLPNPQDSPAYPSMVVPCLGIGPNKPIHQPASANIWIITTTEFFIKLVETIPIKKATRVVISIFLREHIIYALAYHSKLSWTMTHHSSTNMLILPLLTLASSTKGRHHIIHKVTTKLRPLQGHFKDHNQDDIDYMAK